MKTFLTLCLMQSIDAGEVTCRRKNKKYRDRFRFNLNQGLSIFVVVSYASINSETSKEIGLIPFEIERHFSTIHVPVTFSVSNNSYGYVHIFTAETLNNFIGFEPYQVILSENSSFEQRKVYFYSSLLPLLNSSEMVCFETCLMTLENQELRFEKSILVLILGNEINKEKTVQNLKVNQTVMKNFKFEDFDDQNYAVCKHLEFYLDECVNAEKKLWIYFVEFVVCIVFGFVVVKWFRCRENATVELNHFHTRQNQVAPVVIQTITIAPRSRLVWA
jgi:hypothetical protein